MKIINLKERFGHRYRIAYDPAYDPKHRKHVDAHYMIIPCRVGEIWPHGGSTLAVEIEGKRSITVKRLIAAGCTLYRDGDDGATLLFHVDDFPAVAAIVKPRRRRQVSEATRQAARARLLANPIHKPAA